MDKQELAAESEAVSYRQHTRIPHSSKRLKRLRVEFTTSLAYTAPSNGVAERMNRTLLDKARAMLADAAMNKTFWFKVVMHAAYLPSRTVTHTLRKKTPQKALLGNAQIIVSYEFFGRYFIHLSISITE